MARGAFPIEPLREALLEVLRERFRLARGEWRPRHGGREAGGKGGSAFTAAEWRALGRDVAALHELYTSGAADFAHDRNPLQGRLAGYQVYFLPRNLFRVLHVLRGLPWAEGAGAGRGLAWGGAGRSLRVLDLGCGSGAFSLAVVAWLAGNAAGGGELPPVSFILVDQGRALTELAEANLRAFARRALPGLSLTVEQHAGGMERFLSRPAAASEPFALAGSAMTLNELRLLAPGRGGSRAGRIVGQVRKLTAEGGTMLWVEPGTRKGYLNLMAARGHLTDLPILYPCPHGMVCPLYDQRVSRWCHATVALPEDFAFDVPLRAQGGVTLAMGELNLAALAVQNAPGGVPVAPFASWRGSRVVSGWLPAKQGREGPRSEGERVVLLCTRAGKLREVPAGEWGWPPRGAWLAEERR